MVQPVAKMSITELMKLTLKMGLECNFETVANMGLSHRRMFVMCCIVGDIIAQGSGCGKNKAKHEAARMALNKLKESQLYVDFVKCKFLDLTFQLKFLDLLRCPVKPFSV